MKKAVNLTGCCRSTISSCLGGLLLMCILSVPMFGQVQLSTTLQLVANIPIPTWTTSGATAASFDVLTFNRATGVMYIADRPNKGATAIDMKTWTYLGTLELPGCRANTACSPSGVLVAPDLQKLIVTDRDTKIYIYDLRVPSQSPSAILTGPPGTDELDYDPINQRAYIGNTGSNFAVTVVDVKNNKVLGSIPVATAPEQPRFNPVDGLIYVNVPGQQRVVVIDPQRGAFGEVVNGFVQPGANGDCANAIDIDPVTNTAFLGCSAGTSYFMDLRTGATSGSFQTTGSDIGMFNPHNRTWYIGADNRGTPASVSLPCPKDSTGRTGMLVAYTNATTPARVACGGRGGIRAGIDTLNNNIVYPVVQYPPDAASADTGRPGVMIFHDSAPDVFGVPAGSVQSVSNATLAAVGGSGISGTATITLRRRNLFVDAGLTGIGQTGANSTLLVVTTTAGNETINCGVNANGAGFCQGNLVGDPLIGGVIDVGVGGIRAASGTITSTATFPTFIPTD